ncbi:hypothetical protein ACIBSW_12595 [Actinoplanes sp. NPDC049668]|uniref:hypothetical protein n=1 Tax=unclassified Actinoplanes TaxID=2626549 RepID=UPI0033B3425A
MEGWQFAAELSQLRVVSRVDLPALSHAYASMNQAVDRTAGQEGGAFAAPGGGVAPAHGLWSSLRDDLQNILGRTATNMLDAGVVLEHIVDTYAAADAAAASSLEAAWAGGQTPGLLEAEERFTREVLPPVVLKTDD